MTIKKQFLLLIALLLSSFFESAQIKIKNFQLFVEIVESTEDRARGLMYRTELDANAGMLFIWPEADRKCMWMKNTSIPLSVAYLDERYVIREIYDLIPYSEKNVCSKSKKIKYALEVNKDWFKEKDIRILSKVSLLD